MQQKTCANPYTLKQSHFLLLKDVHTPNIQHRLIKLCIKYTNTWNHQQVTTVDYLDQCKYSEFKVLCFIWAIYIEKELLIANEHLTAGTGLEEILGNISFYKAGLQTVTVDVNHIHKAKYSVKLSFVVITLMYFLCRN